MTKTVLNSINNKSYQHLVEHITHWRNMVSFGTKLPLGEAMAILGVSVQDLEYMTGLSIHTIRRAVMGGKVKTNITCAERIAAALGMKIDEISWPSGLTHVGRHALTGVPIGAHRAKQLGAQCPDCSLMLPLSGTCDCA